MSNKTAIQWTQATWNPIRGCSIVSKGCTNCYAMKQAHRFNGAGQAYDGLTKMTNGGPVWTGAIRLVPEKLEEPLRWTKPRRVFVNSMSDLFHEDVPFGFIDRVFAVMALSPQHTFQVLTKRPERMREYCADQEADKRVWGVAYEYSDSILPALGAHGARWGGELPWPLANVWLGVSVEDQETADERIPLLLDTPAAVRFVSAEPLLGPVDLYGGDPDPRLCGVVAGDGLSIEQYWKPDGSGPYPGVDWVIVGGESGSGARPCDVIWVRSIVEQCAAASCPVFVKQLGRHPRGWCALNGDTDDPIECQAWEASEHGHCGDECPYFRDRKGGDMDEWPSDLRIREFP